MEQAEQAERAEKADVSGCEGVVDPADTSAASNGDGRERSVPDIGTLGELIQRIRVAFTSGRLAEAVDLLDLADDLEQSEEDRLTFARVRSVTLSRAGEHEQALRALEGVTEGWLERGDLSSAATSCSFEAYVHNMLGDLDAALDAGAWSLMLLDEIDDAGRTDPDGLDPAVRVQAATVRNTLGLMFLDLEAIDLAIGEFSRALRLAGGDDPVLAGIVRGNLASAFLRKALRFRSSDGRIKGADDELEGAERLARELLASDVPARRQVEAASVLAAVLLNTDRGDEAADVLSRHVQHEHLVDDPRALVDWNLLWARSHRAHGEFDDAMARVERAVALADRASDRIAVSLAIRERSRIKEGAGDVSGALADLRAADDGSRELRSSRFEALVVQLIRRAQLEASRRRLEREAAHLGAEHVRLVVAAETDPLTGVGNRRRLMAKLSAVAARGAEPTSVVMIDVDNFKEFNDGLGHAFGDRVLVELAGALQSLARDADVICRPGGDEFVMILPGADHVVALSVAARIRDRVADLVWDGSGGVYPLREAGAASSDTVTVSVSLGVASGPAEQVTATMGEADRALLDAKRRGRDRVSVAGAL